MDGGWEYYWIQEGTGVENGKRKIGELMGGGGFARLEIPSCTMLFLRPIDIKSKTLAKTCAHLLALLATETS